jgi:hypothetical protein
MSMCKRPGCIKKAEPGSNFCSKHDLDGKGVHYLKDDSKTKLKSNDDYS